MSAAIWTNASTGGSLVDWFLFDPSGTVGNSTFPDNVTPAIMPSFAAFAALYKWYKVKKIKLKVRVKNTVGANVNLLNNTIELVWRHDYDFTGPAPASTGWIEGYENVRRVRFTAEAPQVSITLYPRVQVPVFSIDQGTANFSLQAFTPKKMPWTDCSRPVSLYGLRMYIPQIPAGLNFDVDVTYHCVFKGRA